MKKASIKRRSWEVRAAEIRKLVRPAKADDTFESVPSGGGQAA
jgi:hypothetical protein